MSSSCHTKVAGTFGTIEISVHDQAVVVDTTSRNYDVAGYLHVGHSFVRFSVKDAYRLHELLSDAIAYAEECEPRQPVLWSDATAFRAVRA